jgi:DNA-binding MarR family transcriptional regulator
MSKNSNKSSRPGLAFLLSQVGAHAAARFGERIAPLKIKPYHSGILHLLENEPGLTQQGLCDLLGMFPSRLVGLLDELQKLKLIERRESPLDRRIHALYLTKAGSAMVVEIGKLARRHQDDLCAALNEKERALLAELLSRIVAQQNITPAVHPGYRQLGGSSGREGVEKG